MGDVGEIAKAVTPLVDNLAKLTGPMSEELGQYFGDKVREFRQRNMTTIVDGAVKRLEEAKKPVDPVPPRLLLPIIDSASLEDNPTLQEMWSGLLASASDQADNMSPSYVETLKALTPIEARSIKVLYDFLIESTGTTLGSDEDVSYRLTFGLGLVEGELIAPTLIIETLERLGLIRREYDLDRNPSIRDMYPNYLIPPASVSPMFTTPQAVWDAAANAMPRTSESLPLMVYGTPGFTADDTTWNMPTNRADRTPEPLPKVIYDLAFTSYGIQFMRACQGPVSLVPEASRSSDIHPLG